MKATHHSFEFLLAWQVILGDSDAVVAARQCGVDLKCIRRAKDGDIFKFGSGGPENQADNIQMSTLHTPGHTPGSICISLTSQSGYMTFFFAVLELTSMHEEKITRNIY